MRQFAEVVRKDGYGDPVGFRVYEDWRAHGRQATVHRAECGQVTKALVSAVVFGRTMATGMDPSAP